MAVCSSIVALEVPYRLSPNCALLEMALAGDAGEGEGAECRRVPLDKAVPGLELEELLLGHKVVVDCVLLARTGAARGVRDGEREGVRVSLARGRVSGIAIACGW